MLSGIDVLRRGRHSSARKRLKGARVGMLTHAAALDRSGYASIETLRHSGIEPEVVFSPEHGWYGLAQAEVAVTEDEDRLGEANLISLYGSTKESLSPKLDDLEGLDVLLIDLVDIGSRYYTYIWTAVLAARAAHKAGVHTMILDRPNPLGSLAQHLEGRPQDDDYLSFVGLEPLPIRHCMTIGEVVAHVLNQEEIPLGPDGALSIVATEGWERHRIASAQAAPFIPPSPNMPSLQTALVYPGGCLLEGTNLSEGRGTTTPFQNIGAPFLNGQQLASSLELPGAWLRPTRFRPSFDKYAGEICEGIQLQVSDPHTFRPVEAYLRIIAAARRQAPEEFKFLDRVYEFETERPAFDLLTGSREARTLIEEDRPVDEVVDFICPVEEDWEIRLEAAEELVEEIQA